MGGQCFRTIRGRNFHDNEGFAFGELCNDKVSRFVYVLPP